MKRLLLIVLALAFAMPAVAANHYVRQGASGTGTGADWTNAYTDFGVCGSCVSLTGMTRGDTYYVATGAYCSLGCNFNTTASTTVVITIKGATVADHGAATGWSNAYSVNAADGGTSATFPSNSVQFFTSYHTFDGNVDSGGTRANYGFNIDQSSCGGPQHAVAIGAGGATVAGTKILHTAFLGCATDIEKVGIYQQTTTVNNSCDFAHNLFDGFQNWVFIGTGGSTGCTIEYNYVVNASTSGTHHGLGIDMADGTASPVIRFNTILSCAGTSCGGPNDAGSPCLTGVTNAEIYGNIINSGGLTTGDGIIGPPTNCFFVNAKVYNNTVANGNSPWFAACVSGASVCSSATGNSANDNLVYGMNAGIGGGTITHDYNTYSSTTNAPTEAHGQITATNFFLNYAGSDYHLASDTSAWDSNAAGPAGNTVDLDGVTRTSSRGAYQFVGGTSPTAALTASPAVILKGTSSTLSSTCTNSTSASIDNGVGAVSPTTASTPVTPTATTTYTLTCFGNATSAQASASATIGGAAQGANTIRTANTVVQ